MRIYSNRYVMQSQIVQRETYCVLEEFSRAAFPMTKMQGIIPSSVVSSLPATTVVAEASSQLDEALDLQGS